MVGSNDDNIDCRLPILELSRLDLDELLKSFTSRSAYFDSAGSVLILDRSFVDAVCGLSWFWEDVVEFRRVLVLSFSISLFMENLCSV